MLFALILGILASAPKTTTYAVVIGVNDPPSHNDEGLQRLAYADDDAVRYYKFLSRFSDDVYLFTVLDEETDRRHRELGRHNRVPSLRNIMQTFATLEGRARADLAQGNDVIVYVVFSGHGIRDNAGEPALVLSDATLGRALLYDEILARLPATYVHLIIDACHSKELVAGRGFFDVERSARTVAVTTAQATDAGLASRFPHVGILTATTSSNETHEWSRVQSGVFSHEVLSALSGAADVNADGAIEYSEVQAFIAGANREIDDSRAMPQVLAEAPRLNRRVPLVQLSQLRDVFYLRGDASTLGHFYVELQSGERYLDAHLARQTVTLALPSETAVHVRTASSEASLLAPSGTTISFASLRLRPVEVAARGSIESSFRRSLFASPFSQPYYQGYIDSFGITGVTFAAPAAVGSRGRALAAYLPASALALVSAASFVGTAVWSRRMWLAEDRLERTTKQREAYEQDESFRRHRALTLSSGAVALVSALGALWLWPDSQSDVSLVWQAEGAGLVWTVPLP